MIKHHRILCKHLINNNKLITNIIGSGKIHANTLNKISYPFQPTLLRKFTSCTVQQTTSNQTTTTSSRSKLFDIELTTNRFNESLKRGPFSVLTDADIQHFENILEPKRVVTDELEIIGHNVDWLHMVRGASKLLLKPKTTKEVSEILKYAYQRNLAVCPQGGNTGLVGGGVPVYDEIILSTNLMNEIISLDPVSGIVTCQPGCILENLSNYLLENGFIMPLDLGAKGSCHIGGNVACNAGGLRVVRYGSLHSTVLGIEAVLADGTIFDCMSSMKKDNTGYDLKHLFIGSEGTLGIITKVAIQCPVKPTSINCCILGLQNFNDVLQTLKIAKIELNSIISSFEYMDLESMQAVTNNLKLKNVLSEFPFYILLETSGSNSTHDNEKLETFLQNVMNQNLVVDGVVASSEKERLAIWELRERVAEAFMKDGFFYAYDLSISATKFEEIVQETRRQLDFGENGAIRCCGLGHLGDGNIHLNVTSAEFNPYVLARIEPFIYERVKALKGSVSAEHGLGFKKKQFISYSKSPEPIQMMKQIKNLFDPKGILNPYKMLV